MARWAVGRRCIIRIYGLTKLGKKITSNGASGDGEEVKVLQYLRENRTATDSELEVVGGERWLLKRLKSRGLVQELTT